MQVEQIIFLHLQDDTTRPLFQVSLVNDGPVTLELEAPPSGEKDLAESQEK